MLQPWIDLDPPGFLISGEYIGNITLTRDWLEFDKNLEIDAYNGIKTIDGIFLIDKRDIEEYNLKKGNKVNFYADRVDLLSWHPIK